MKGIYIAVFVLTIVMVGGFYFIFDKIWGLQSDLQNVQLFIEVLKEKENSSQQLSEILKQKNVVTPSPQATSSVPAAIEQEIKTAIVFEATSSPSLLPQTKITIFIEKAIKRNDMLSFSIKAITNKAASYSSFEPESAFKIIDLKSADDIFPKEVRGTFKSIPSKSEAEGVVIFGVSESENKFILQFGQGSEAHYYEFDFLKKTYKETVIG